MIKLKSINDDLSKWLKDFTKTKLLKKTNFVKEGYLDSFKFLELIIFLEKKYKISFDSNFLQNNNNYTIDKISKEVLKKVNE